MPGSEVSGKRSLDGLIRDIGRSEVRGSNPATSERHLMQLAGDPLLVGRFIARQEGEPTLRPGPSAPVPGEVTLALARSIVAEGSIDQWGGTARLRQYESTEPRHYTSLSPLPFAPSRTDRENALDLAGGRPGEDAHARQSSRATPIIAVIGVSLVMLLLGLRVVLD
jgi:hypothetical protein